MTDFVIVSSDLRPYVLDTWVKRGGELSTDYHLVVSWIRWRGSRLDRPGKPKRVVRVNWERLGGPCPGGLQLPRPDELLTHPEGGREHAIQVDHVQSLDCGSGR